MQGYFSEFSVFFKGLSGKMHFEAVRCIIIRAPDGNKNVGVEESGDG